MAMYNNTVKIFCTDIKSKLIYMTCLVHPKLSPSHPDVCWLQATSWLSCYFMLSVGLWVIRSYVSTFQSRMCFLKACVRRVSDAENLSVCLASEGELLCLLNLSDKTYVKMSVTHTFIEIFILSYHICIFMFGIFSGLKVLKLHSTCFLSCCCFCPN